MPSLSEHLAAIATSRSALHDAIAGAAASWEEASLAPEADELNPSATGDAWTPQQAAGHVIGAIGFFTGFAAAGLNVEFAPSPPQVDTPEQALASIGVAFDAFDGVAKSITDGSLTTAAPVGDGQIAYAATRGFTIEKNIAGALSMVELHTADHAAQIARGAS